MSRLGRVFLKQQRGLTYDQQLQLLELSDEYEPNGSWDLMLAAVSSLATRFGIENATRCERAHCRELVQLKDRVATLEDVADAATDALNHQHTRLSETRKDIEACQEASCANCAQLREHSDVLHRHGNTLDNLAGTERSAPARARPEPARTVMQLIDDRTSIFRERLEAARDKRSEWAAAGGLDPANYPDRTASIEVLAHDGQFWVVRSRERPPLSEHKIAFGAGTGTMRIYAGSKPPGPEMPAVDRTVVAGPFESRARAHNAARNVGAIEEREVKARPSQIPLETGLRIGPMGTVYPPNQPYVTIVQSKYLPLWRAWASWWPDHSYSFSQLFSTGYSSWTTRDHAVENACRIAEAHPRHCAILRLPDA